MPSALRAALELASSSASAISMFSLSAIAESTSSVLTRRSASGRNSVRTCVSVALGDAQVLLVADALLGEADLELVEHHLELAVDQQVGQLDRGVGNGELDDAVGEDVARPVERVALQAPLDLRAQRGEVVV